LFLRSTPPFGPGPFFYSFGGSRANPFGSPFPPHSRRPPVSPGVFSPPPQCRWRPPSSSPTFLAVYQGAGFLFAFFFFFSFKGASGPFPPYFKGGLHVPLICSAFFVVTFLRFFSPPKPALFLSVKMSFSHPPRARSSPRRFPPLSLVPLPLHWVFFFSLFFFFLFFFGENPTPGPVYPLCSRPRFTLPPPVLGRLLACVGVPLQNWSLDFFPSALLIFLFFSGFALSFFFPPFWLFGRFFFSSLVLWCFLPQVVASLGPKVDRFFFSCEVGIWFPPLPRRFSKKPCLAFFPRFVVGSGVGGFGVGLWGEWHFF